MGYYIIIYFSLNLLIWNMMLKKGRPEDIPAWFTDSFVIMFGVLMFLFGIVFKIVKNKKP